jgi:hypothetical protein
MLASGTTDGNSHIATILLFEAWNPGLKKIYQGIVHGGDFRKTFEIFDNCLVSASEDSQVGFPMWIWQAAKIKYKIGIVWQAMFETKRLYQYGEFGSAIW